MQHYVSVCCVLSPMKTVSADCQIVLAHSGFKTMTLGWKSLCTAVNENCFNTDWYQQLRHRVMVLYNENLVVSFLTFFHFLYFVFILSPTDPCCLIKGNFCILSHNCDVCDVCHTRARWAGLVMLLVAISVIIWGWFWKKENFVFN